MPRYIFDIDDTLYLERDYVRSGFRAVGRAASRPEFGEECFRLFLEGVRGNTFDLARRSFPDVVMPVPEMVEIYRTHVPEIALCDDARRFIESLAEPSAVITDGPIASQRAKYRALGLVPWIDCPIFTAEILAPKPSPVPFRLACWGIYADPGDCIYIADNPAKDFAGARACGIGTVRICRPDSLHADVPSGDDVDREIKSFDDML